MVELKQKKMPVSCRKETKSVTDCLLELEDVSIICIGPASCLRTFYFQEGELDILDHVFLCQLDQTDYLTGDIYSKLEKTVEQAVLLPDIKGIVLFAGCSDYIIQTDYDSMVLELEATYSLPFFQIWRGPIAKCQHNSKEEIKEIANILADKKPRKHVESEKEIFKLPVLASDIAGVASLIEDWNCLRVLYTPGSCTDSFADNSLLAKQSNFYYTHFSDIDLSLGGTSDILSFICEHHDGKEDVCLMGSPLNHFVHGDYEELSESLKMEDISVLPFITEGFEEAAIGISKGLMDAGNYFLENETKERTPKNQINLIGFTKLTLGNIINIDELKEKLAWNNYELNVIEGNLRDAFSSILVGQVNWIVSEEGLDLAKWLQKNYQIPYIVDLPIGRLGFERCIEQLTPFCDIQLIDRDEEVRDIERTLQKKHVLLLGRPSINEGLEKMLQLEFECQSVTSRTYLPTENLAYFYQDKAVGFSTIEELAAEKRSYDVIIGDSAYQKGCQFYFPKASFIPLNDGVVSGSVSEKTMSLTGISGNNWLTSFL
ncbi:nitrogenase component 1 [Vagococcus carniphilus]|uniref:Nitrogenase component 1 n=1 Tax=Vagococcus carniphilus TaxID=218144 RepID=A0AAW8U1C4_9ENTE|nr:nitrogenase component 1 [Vagococcus carniphilus]MDT2832874.1 nitrogenase component 1 [Vagococcus carniphilus]